MIAIEKGRKNYRKILLNLAGTIEPLVSRLAGQLLGEEYTSAAARLAGILKEGVEIPMLTNFELIILQKALLNLPENILLETKFPPLSDFLSRSDLKVKVNTWLEELPDKPVLVRV